MLKDLNKWIRAQLVPACKHTLKHELVLLADLRGQTYSSVILGFIQESFMSY